MGSITRDLYTPSPVYQAQTSDPAPVPTLYLIRHGQAEHNVNPSHVSRRDTILTEAGRLQAAKLRASLPNSSRRNIGVVVSSPLRRALQTALIGFEELILADRAKVIANGISDDSAATDQSQSRTQPFRLVALPEAQETSDLPCDTGLPVADLAAEFDALDSKWRGCVNFDLVSAEEWGSKTGRWACDRETLEKRARDTRIWLRQKMRQLSLSENHPTTTKGEKVHVRGDCVLVTHGGFLHLLTEDWEGFDAKAGTGWANTEVRAYNFVTGLESTADAKATIVETVQSRRARLEGRSGRPGPKTMPQIHPTLTSLAALDNEGIQVES